MATQTLYLDIHQLIHVIIAEISTRGQIFCQHCGVNCWPFQNRYEMSPGACVQCTMLCTTYVFLLYCLLPNIFLNTSLTQCQIKIMHQLCNISFNSGHDCSGFAKQQATVPYLFSFYFGGQANILCNQMPSMASLHLVPFNWSIHFGILTEDSPIFGKKQAYNFQDSKHAILNGGGKFYSQMWLCYKFVKMTV